MGLRRKAPPGRKRKLVSGKLEEAHFLSPFSTPGGFWVGIKEVDIV
jgi:hypothetical protein